MKIILTSVILAISFFAFSRELNTQTEIQQHVVQFDKGKKAKKRKRINRRRKRKCRQAARRNFAG